MLLTDIYYQAGEIEARAVRYPSWARPHDPITSASHRRGPRRLVGQALINLGHAISAEPKPVGTIARVAPR